MKHLLCAVTIPALILGILTGCGSTDPSSSDCDAIAGALVTRIEVQPSSVEVHLGDSLQLNATAFSCSGPLSDVGTIQWQSDQPTVATVGAAGLVKAERSGSAVIRAVIQGKEGSATVTTTLVPVDRVTVEPEATAIGVGRTSTLTARAFDSKGQELSGRAVSWSSANTDLVTVSSTGGITGLAVGGPIAVTATIEGESAHAQVTVVQVPVNSVEVSPPTAEIAAGNATQLGATLRDDQNNVLTGRAVNWTSSDAAVASVTGAGGRVTGHTPGIATITATSEGKSGTAQVTVTIGAPARLAFVVQPGSAEAGTVLTPAVTVEVQDAAGNRVPTASSAITMDLVGSDGATLSGTRTVNAVNGLASFTDLAVSGPGTFQLAAGAASLTSATSASFVITGRPAVRLGFVRQPGSAQAGASLGTITVELLDATGARASSETRSITLALVGGDSSGTLSGAITQSTINGIATFTGLSVDRSGTGYTLAASTADLTGATSDPFDISTGPASRLRFIVQPCPNDCRSKTDLLPAPQVAVQDASGNLVSGAIALIAVSLEGESRNVHLDGTTIQLTASGVATFANLSVSRNANRLTLRATALGLAADTTATFNISNQGP